MTLKFSFVKFVIFLLLLIICYFVYNINGEDSIKNDTNQETSFDDEKSIISLRDIFGIFAGIIVAAPPIIVLVILLTYQRDSIKVGKINKYYKLKTVGGDVDKTDSNGDGVIFLPNGAVSIELTKF